MPVIPLMIALVVFVLFLALAVTVAWYLILPLTLLWILGAGIGAVIHWWQNTRGNNGCRLRRTETPVRPRQAPIIDVDYTEVP